MSSRERRIGDALDAVASKHVGDGATVVMVVHGNDTTMVTRGGTAVTASPAECYYQCGSISKWLTAVACLVLDTESVVTLDAPLRHAADWIPTYAGMSVPISMRAICHHITGLNVRICAGQPRDGAIPSLPDIADGRGGSPALAFLGIPLLRTIYSSGAFILLQMELEGVCGPDYGGVVTAALRAIAPACQAFLDTPTDLPTEFCARGHFHSQVPVSRGSMHYPESCSQGFWARPSDLMALLVELARCRRSLDIGDRLGRRVARTLTERLYHRRMAMSVLVDGDHDGTEYFSAQGQNAGFSAELASHPDEDLHVVAMTSAPVAAADLHYVVQTALAGGRASQGGGMSGRAPSPRHAIKPASSDLGQAPRRADIAAWVEARIRGSAAVVQVGARPGLQLNMVRFASGRYRVPGTAAPELLVSDGVAHLLDQIGACEMRESSLHCDSEQAPEAGPPPSHCEHLYASAPRQAKPRG